MQAYTYSFFIQNKNINFLVHCVNILCHDFNQNERSVVFKT